MRSLMMIGLEVAPVAPHLRFWVTASGSTESSHNLVPVAMSDLSGSTSIFQSSRVMRSSPVRSLYVSVLLRLCTGPRLKPRLQLAPPPRELEMVYVQSPTRRQRTGSG